jgi:hypothetical protein
VSLLLLFLALAGGNVDVPATGVVGTGAVGSVTVTGAATVSATGVSGTGAVGSVTVEAGATVSASGVSGTGAVGDETVAAAGNANASWVSGAGAVGDESVTGDANASASGSAAAEAVGSVVVSIQNEPTPEGPYRHTGGGGSRHLWESSAFVFGVDAVGEVGRVGVQRVTRQTRVAPATLPEPAIAGAAPMSSPRRWGALDHADEEDAAVIVAALLYPMGRLNRKR